MPLLGLYTSTRDNRVGSGYGLHFINVYYKIDRWTPPRRVKGQLKPWMLDFYTAYLFEQYWNEVDPRRQALVISDLVLYRQDSDPRRSFINFRFNRSPWLNIYKEDEGRATLTLQEDLFMVVEEFYITLRDIMTAHHWKSGPLKIPPSILDTIHKEMKGFLPLSDEYSADDRKGLSSIVKSLGKFTSVYATELEQILDELKQRDEYFAVD
jgi:hypothetical protein